jgi:hypothetical protein
MRSRPDSEISKFFESPDGKETVRVGSDTPLISIIDSIGGTTYVGSALAGSLESDSVWQITRVDKVGQTTRVLLAGSSNLFNKSWSLRETYIYG